MRPILPVVFLLAPLSAQSITLLEGPSPTNLTVRTVSESDPGAAGTTVLQQIEIVPIELTGRTVVQALQWQSTRLASRNGLPRVELPGGARLFQYRRLNGGHWGLLLVAADGSARSVLELPVPGASAAPFADRIGVAADGRHAVVPLANGDCSVVRLDGQNFASTGTPARTLNLPSPVVPASLMVGRSCFFCCTQAGQLLRCVLADGNVPLDCTPPPQQGAVLHDQLALSGDGSTAAFLYGPPGQTGIWLLRESGQPTLLPAPPANYRDADYLPEGTGQPQLLLNDAATRLFFIDAQRKDESFLLDLTVNQPPLHITDDPVFEPYIGINILPSFAADTLRLAVGEQHRMDWFTVDLQNGTGQFTNLTQTNPLINPFYPGTIDPTQAVAAGQLLLTTETTPGPLLALRRIDPTAATSQVLLADALSPPIAGSALQGAPDLLLRTQSGDRLFAGASGQLLAAAPPGMSLSPPNHGPAFAATWIDLGGGLGIAAFYLPNGIVLASGLEQGVTQLVMTAGGGCFLNGPSPRYLGLGIYRQLRLPAIAIRLCISGAGG